MSTDDPVPAVARRGLIIGAGAAALVAGAAAVQPAAAKPTSPHGSEVIDNPRSADGSPITTTIASTPISGYTYRTASMYDFEPFYSASQKTWGGQGVYTASSGGPLRASVEIPPGALVRDVEYYIYNNSGSPVSPTPTSRRRHRLACQHRREPLDRKLCQHHRDPGHHSGSELRSLSAGISAARQSDHADRRHGSNQRRPGRLHPGLR